MTADDPDRRLDGLADLDRRSVLRAAGAVSGAALLGAAALLDPGDGGDGTDRLSDREAAMALVDDDRLTHRAVADGTWTDESTWDGESIPGADARVHVPAGTSVELAAELDAGLDRLRIDGDLRIDPSVDTRLGVGTIVVTDEGRLQAGTADEPVGPDATATIEFLDRGPIDADEDPERVGRGLIAMGRTRIYGAERTGWTATATPPRAGDAEIELADEPVGWSAGDRIVVPGLSPRRDEDEQREIRAVDGRTVRLDEALRYDHVPPADDLDAYVVHLDRNVRFRSESDEIPHRGHVMFTTRDVDVRGAGFYDLGRTDKRRPFTDPANGVPPRDVEPNPKARYAVHFHHAGVEPGDPARVRDCAVWGSPGWGYVNHGSRVVVEDCVSYRVTGAGFVAERGDEVGAFRRNFALRSEGSGQRVDARRFHEGETPAPEGRRAHIDDFGHGDHGFWFQGPGVAVEGNVAAGHRHFGFVYWNRALADEPVDPDRIGSVVGKIPNFPVENLDGQADLAHSDRVVDGRVPSSFVKLRSFRDNEAFASGGGLEISRHMFTYPHQRYDEYSVIEGFTVHSVGDFVTHRGQILERAGDLGLKVRYSSNVLVRDCRLLGDGTGAGIRRNEAVDNLVVEDSTIEGWELGHRPPPRGVAHVRGSHLENARNLQVEPGNANQWNPANRLRVEDTTLAGADDADVELSLDLRGRLWGLLAGDDRIAIERRTAYLDEQAPDHVPFPDREAIERLRGTDGLGELTGEGDVEPSALVGLSNRELRERYGVAVRGELLPDDAGPDDRIVGGHLAPAGEEPTVVRLQADAGAVDAPMGIGEDPLASNGRYVTPGEAVSVRRPPRNGRVVYEFEAPAGEYAVWGRVVAPGDDADSFWVAADDSEWVKWDWIDHGRAWHWARVHDADADHEPVTFDLSGESHELVIARREPGTKLDQLLLTDGDYRPFGAEAP